jgi:hypothetical protein
VYGECDVDPKQSPVSWYSPLHCLFDVKVHDPLIELSNVTVPSLAIGGYNCRLASVSVGNQKGKINTASNKQRKANFDVYI